MKNVIAFLRPFTLIAPMLGVISGALTAWGSRHSPWAADRFGWTEVSLVLIAAMAAALLNAAGNGINQICDLDIDKVNKPNRPLASGALSMKTAVWVTTLTYIFSVLITWIVVPVPEMNWAQRLLAPWFFHECIVFYFLAAVFTLIYSVPSLGRTKQMTFGANLTIAIPRGLMLKVAGWSTLASVWHVEPWYIGFIFFLFLLGAASTKDFSDMAGDLEGGCRTLPNRFGVRRAAVIIAPFFVLPWLLIPVGLVIKPDGEHAILSGSPSFLLFLCASLLTWGIYTVYLMLRDPEALGKRENHPSWKHMYLMMFWAQIGFALAYLMP